MPPSSWSEDELSGTIVFVLSPCSITISLGNLGSLRCWSVSGLISVCTGSVTGKSLATSCVAEGFAVSENESIAVSGIVELSDRVAVVLGVSGEVAACGCDCLIGGWTTGLV